MPPETRNRSKWAVEARNREADLRAVLAATERHQQRLLAAHEALASEVEAANEEYLEAIRQVMT